MTLIVTHAGHLEPEDVPQAPCIILQGSREDIKAAAALLFDAVKVVPADAKEKSQ